MPVGGFNIGQGVSNARQAHAGATSVSGIGGAIRGILENARAKGLVGEQARAQTEGSIQLQQFKNDNPQTGRIRQVVVDPKTNLPSVIDLGETTSADKTFAQPSQKTDTIGDLIRSINGEGQVGVGNSQVGIQDILPQAAAPTQTGDDDNEIVTIRFSDGNTQDMTIGEARSRGLIQ